MPAQPPLPLTADQGVKADGGVSAAPGPWDPVSRESSVLLVGSLVDVGAVCGGGCAGGALQAGLIPPAVPSSVRKCLPKGRPPTGAPGRLQFGGSSGGGGGTVWRGHSYEGDGFLPQKEGEALAVSFKSGSLRDRSTMPVMNAVAAPELSPPSFSVEFAFL